MVGFTLTGASIVPPDSTAEPTVTTWSRLEGVPLSADLEPALSAAVADPLWLLCRQWQFLEFAGEDAGTPIDVRVEGVRSTLSRYLPGPLDAAAASRARDFSAADSALEVVVEAEPVRARHARLAVEAGVQLKWMLNNGRLNNLFAVAYPLEVTQPPEGDRAGSEWQAIAAAGRSIDTRTLLAAVVPLLDGTGQLTALPARPEVPTELQTVALTALQRWLDWLGEGIVDPATIEAWNPSRQEYAFSVSAQTSAGELVLSAEEYTDGTVDWFTFSPTTAGSLGPSPGSGAPLPLTAQPVIPTPVDYAGKPADRFWEFEDATVQFGNIDAGPTDLTRILLVEFGLVYGNDWFVVPLRLPVGSLFRITAFNVLDTFGVSSTLTRSRNLDGPRWSVFDLADDQFFLPPTLAQNLSGAAIEQVQLGRDESANLAWGIERRVPGVCGDGYDRSDESPVDEVTDADLTGLGDGLIYRLASTVPDRWIPFTPVSADPALAGINPVVRLERRALQRIGPDGRRSTVQPRGLLLRSDPDLAPEAEPPLRLEEEEVPREGALVERSFQHARWFGGAALLWLGRRKITGRGEASSGLRFDSLRRPGP